MDQPRYIYIMLYLLFKVLSANIAIPILQCWILKYSIFQNLNFTLRNAPNITCTWKRVINFLCVRRNGLITRPGTTIIIIYFFSVANHHQPGNAALCSLYPSNECEWNTLVFLSTLLSSNYLVSMQAGDLDRISPNFLGKLRANFVGTEFQVCHLLVLVLYPNHDGTTHTCTHTQCSGLLDIKWYWGRRMLPPLRRFSLYTDRNCSL